MKTLTINLPYKKIPIIIGKPISKFGKFFINSISSSKALIITNPSIKKLFGHRLERSLINRKVSVLWEEIPAGEEFKNLKTVENLYKKCISLKLDRSSAIVALGGGTVGDIAGFVAATLFRGLPYAQIPTTILAMVDSSIGGKVGVDLPEGKNLVGSFYQPELIFISTEFLRSLPPREVKSGLAEVIKYAIISDKKLFEYLERVNLKRLDWLYIIEACARIKSAIVEADEKELLGKRELLNFGHTIGHSLEVLTKYKKYTHGEAVAMGIIYECMLAEQLTKFSETYRVKNLIAAMGLPTKPDFYIDPAELSEAILRDKKLKDKIITIVLPSKIGVPQYLKLPYESLKSNLSKVQIS